MYLSVTNNYNTIFATTLNQDKSLSFKEIKNYPLELFTNGYDDSSPYRALIGNEPLNKIDLDSVYKYQSFKKENSKISNLEMFNVIDPCYQYIRNEFKNGSFEVKPRYWYLDIETDLDDGKFSSPKKANAPITLLQVAESDTSMKFIFGWMQDYKTDREDVKYFWFEDEISMINAFIQLYLRRQPGVTTAWNGDGFDFPYITTRMTKIGLDPALLSPFNEMEEHSTMIYGQKEKMLKPIGLFWVDTMDVYKKLFPGSRESWSLDYIAKYEKIEGKLHWQDEGFKTFGDFSKGNYNPTGDTVRGKLWELYQQPRTPANEVEMKKEAYKIFVEYGIRDVEVLLEMDRKKKMLNLLMTLSWTMHCNLYDVFGTTKPWTIFIYNDVRDMNKALPAKTKMEDREYGGGFVYAEPGVHKWVFSEDYASLYPNIMMQKGLSPESYVNEEDIPADLFELILSTGIYRAINCDDLYINMSEEVKHNITDLLIKYNLTMGVNGTCYDRSIDGIIPSKVSQIYKERKYHKKEMKKAETIVEQIKKELEARGEKLG